MLTTKATRSINHIHKFNCSFSELQQSINFKLLSILFFLSLFLWFCFEPSMFYRHCHFWKLLTTGDRILIATIQRPSECVERGNYSLNCPISSSSWRNSSTAVNHFKESVLHFPSLFSYLLHNFCILCERRNEDKCKFWWMNRGKKSWNHINVNLIA